jgi:hypothetical protein
MQYWIESRGPLVSTPTTYPAGPGSILGSDISYSDVYMWFSPIPPPPPPEAHVYVALQIIPWPLRSTSFQINCLLIIP